MIVLLMVRARVPQATLVQQWVKEVAKWLGMERLKVGAASQELGRQTVPWCETMPQRL